MNQPEQQSQSEAKVEVVEQELYAKHKKVYARETPGKFNNLRWALVFLTQIIFYFGPWLYQHLLDELISFVEQLVQVSQESLFQ